jgi:hypothetical protein
VNSFTTALNSFQLAQRKQKDKEMTQRQRGQMGARGFVSILCHSIQQVWIAKALNNLNQVLAATWSGFFSW